MEAVIRKNGIIFYKPNISCIEIELNAMTHFLLVDK